VRAAYLQRAARFPGRIRLVQASESIAEVRKVLETVLSTICIK